MILTLSGKNDYELQRRLQELIRSHKQRHSDMTLHHFNPEEHELEQVAEAVHAVPFLASESLVVVRQFSKQKSLHDELIQLVESVPDSTTLVFVEPNLDKRTALNKVLRSRTDFEEFAPLNEQQLVDWVAKQAEEKKLKLDSSLARLLVQRVGENQWLLSSELDKLAHADMEINRDVLEDIVPASPRESIFELLDAIAARNNADAMQTYRELIQAQAEPHYILSMIIWQLRNLTIAVHGHDVTDNELIKDYKISPYVLRKSRQAARNLDAQRIAKMWELVMQLDYQLKSSPLNDELAVEQLIARLAT